MIKQEPVFAPPRQDVQTEAHLPQEGLRCFQAAQLRNRQEPASGEAIERVGAEVSLCHPGNGLDVAQSAGTGLYIGLEDVGRIVGLGVTIRLLANLGIEELSDRPYMFGGEGGSHAIDLSGISRELPGFEERRHDAYIGGGFLYALID